jgi:PrcB C-terminal
LSLLLIMMFSMKAITMAVLLSLALNGVGAAGCDSKHGDSKQSVNQSKNTGSPPATPEPVLDAEQVASGGDLKIIAEGSQSGVDDAFIAVARDAETYAALSELSGQLPEVSADSFKGSVVVAAFLGRRNTGGYGIEVNRAAGGSLRLTGMRPAKDAMVTQALTTPFKVVTVPITSEQALSIEMQGEWKSMTRPYRVTAGDFTVTGGFAGTTEKFQLEGQVGIMRQGKLATLFFDLKSTGGARQRALKDVATGVVQADGQIALTHLAAGSFVNPPPGALRATGKLAGDENNLSLAFESLPSNVADGYEGRGKLEAAATAGPPQKRKPLSAMNRQS